MTHSWVLVITLFSVALGIVNAGCVENNTADLSECLHHLQVAMLVENPQNMTEFFCGPANKENFNCVIQHFVACPEFKNATDILQPGSWGRQFDVMELFHVDSADHFCSCSSFGTCLMKIAIDSLSEPLDGWPWSRLVKHNYACNSSVQSNIRCVLKAPATCTDYLRLKSAELSSSALTNTLEFASKRCQSAPPDLTCTTQHARGGTFELCYNQSRYLSSDVEKACGIRSCLEQYMGWCPEGEMVYFIDAVNVFSGVHIQADTCRLYSGVPGPPSLTACLLGLAMILSRLT